jgi:predicted MPP superfamily phosphohydrolase
MKNKQYKIIALGDTHGTNKWKKIVKANKDADKIVFLGDYFDSFDIPFSEQYKNFIEILTLKKEQPDKVVLLLGNHEYHYMSKYSYDRYSGHQLHYTGKIEEILTDAIKDGSIQIAYQNDGYLFTHAGVTKEWYENNMLNKDDTIANNINALFDVNPSAFKFTPSSGLDNYGDSITQSPIWVRPRALQSNKIDGLKQVVGHTHQKKIDISGDIIFIDTIEFGNEYLLINNGIPKVGIIE